MLSGSRTWLPVPAPPPGQHHLLLVASREPLDRGPPVGCADREALDPAVDQGGLLGGDDERPAAAHALLGQGHVVGDRHRADHALGLALGRHVADAGGAGRARAGQVQRLAVERHGPRSGLRGAEQGAAQVLAARAVHADDGDDLALTHVQVDVAEGGAGQAPHGEPGCGLLVGVVGSFGHVVVVMVLRARGTDHHPVQLGRDGAGGRDLAGGPAPAQDTDPVADVEDLVEAVGDEDDRGELAQPPYLLEEGLDLARLEHRGGLVEDDHGGEPRALLDAQHLGDLHHLTLGEGEGVGAGQRVDARADLVELLLRHSAHRVPTVDPAAHADPLAAEDDVLGRGEVGHQRLLLEDHPDAVVGGVDDAAQPDLLATDVDLSGVGAHQPDQRLEQGRLTGPVLAGQAEHLVLVHDQVDPVEGLDPRVVLDQTADLERRHGRTPAQVHLELCIDAHLTTWFLCRSGTTAAATAATTMRPCTPPCQ